MSGLVDLWHQWGSDLVSDNTGDLLTASGIDRGQQRILRRLLTNPGDYIFHPEYGAGLPRYIGKAIDAPKLTALILAHMLLEDVVANNPRPTVTVTQSANDTSAFSVVINYLYAPTQKSTVLGFDVGKGS